MKRIIKTLILLMVCFMCFKTNVKAEEISQPTRVVKNSTYAITYDEKLLLQRIAVAEAENEGVVGMCMVMQVVLNRVESDDFPDTIGGVISQKNQFSTYQNGMFQKAQITKESKMALDLLNVLENKGALYFNMVSQNGTWLDNNLSVLYIYKNHKFY